MQYDVPGCSLVAMKEVSVVCCANLSPAKKYSQLLIICVRVDQATPQRRPLKICNEANVEKRFFGSKRFKKRCLEKQNSVICKFKGHFDCKLWK